MPAYKGKAKGIWYASFCYETRTGKETELSYQAGDPGMVADISTAEERRTGYELRKLFGALCRPYQEKHKKTDAILR